MKKLVIIGASYLQLPLVKKAKELNIETHVFAWEDGAVARYTADYFYPISIVDKEVILIKCREIKPNGITSIASDLAMLTVNYIAKELNLIGNSLICSENARNKYTMRKRFVENGIKCPKFIKVRENHNANIEGMQFPLIVKPMDSSGSRGINKVDSIEEIDEAINNAVHYSLSREVIIEEFIKGEEVSVEIISYAGKHYYLTITDKETTGSPYFVETSHHQPSKFIQNLEKSIKDLTFRGLFALQIENGASHTEIKITPNGELYIIEIGARMGGDLIGSDLVQLSTGYDFVKGVVKIALGEFEKPQKYKNKFSGVYFICPKKKGIIQKIIDTACDNTTITHKELIVQIGDKVEPVRKSIDRKGYYVYGSTEKLEDKNLIKLVIE
ncbi:MAG: ATP-grasp domain-containing protein [Candidatus Delongbacteria bacterium]|nr:ATP-grasp domain-containing protein [Candidatus Delongbacteria bacterium]